MDASRVSRNLGPPRESRRPRGAAVPEDVAGDPLEELHPTARAILVAARTVLRARDLAGLTIEALWSWS